MFIEKFLKNYIFLDLIEKNHNLIYLNYKNFIKKWQIKFIKPYFKKFKKYIFQYNWFLLEKFISQNSYLNLNLQNTTTFYWYIKKKKNLIIFHILEKYIYNEYIYFYLNLWKYKSKINYGKIRIIKIFFFSKKIKYLDKIDYIEITYSFNIGLINNNHLSLFLPSFL